MFITENGWPSCNSNQLDLSPVPGTTLKLPIQAGYPSKIMKAFAADINQYVESLFNSRGYADEGGWTSTNSVPTSNHLGGTAMDLNWGDHPMGIALDGWHGSDIIPGEEEPEIRRILAFYEGMIFWGNDWSSPKDSMHFQMGYNTYNNAPKVADFIKRKIRADGFSTYRRGSGAPSGGTIKLADVSQADWDWMLKATSELHGAIFNKVPSTSKYRADDKANFSLNQLMIFTNGAVDEWLVERSAMAGNPDAIALVKREADKGDKAAQYFYNTYCKQS